MTPEWEAPLSSQEAWVGVWFRGRSGPTTKGMTIHVDRWHRVLSIDGRINTVCRPTWQKPWPSGGGRIEIARPHPFSPFEALPGDICPKCASSPVAREIEVQVIPEDVIDSIVERVTEALDARTKAVSGGGQEGAGR